MSRYDKYTWDTNSIYNPTRMNHIEQGIYDADLRDGGEISNTLRINRPEGTTSSVGGSYLMLGNNTPQGTTGNSQGILRLYSPSQYKVDLLSNSLTADRYIYLPDKAGTIALTSDFVKHGVEWSSSGATIPLDRNKFYFVCAGTNTSNYSMCYVLYDGGWVIKGTNTANITTSGDNLKIPQYLRYLILTWE